MKKFWFIGLATLGLLTGVSASAGTVSGKVQLANVSTGSKTVQDKEAVVIWLEGQDEPKPPETAITISQRNLHFSPTFVVAVKGQKVDMPNDDDVAHNVYSFTGMNQFNLGIYPKGESRSVVFEKTGIVDVFCSIHHNMHARVFVVPTRYFANVLPGESFNIHQVPPGKYVLKVWHERSRMLEKAIVVPRTGVVSETLVLENSSPQTTTAAKE